MSKMAELDASFSAGDKHVPGFKLFYVTYGFGSNLAGCYSVVKAQDYASAKAGVMVHTKGRFAFLYDAAQFAGQVEEYGLRRILFQAQECAL